MFIKVHAQATKKASKIKRNSAKLLRIGFYISLDINNAGNTYDERRILTANADYH